MTNGHLVHTLTPLDIMSLVPLISLRSYASPLQNSLQLIKEHLENVMGYTKEYATLIYIDYYYK